MQGTSWWMLKAVWRRRKRSEYFSAFVLITDLQLALSVQVSNHRNFCSLSNHHLKSKEGCFKRESFVGRIWQNGFCPSFSPYRKWLLLISISQFICFNRNAGYVSCAPGFAAAPRVPLQMESVSIRAPSHSWEQVLKSTPPRTWKLGGGRRIQTWGKNGLNRRVTMQKKKPFKNGHFVLHDGVVHSCLAAMPNLLRDLQPVSPSGFTCLCCTHTVLARGKQRAGAAGAAAQSEGSSPPLNRSDPAGLFLVGIPVIGTARQLFAWNIVRGFGRKLCLTTDSHRRHLIVLDR